MNPLLKLPLLLKIGKEYIFHLNRLKKISQQDLVKLQDKQLRKIVKYAYEVPIYYKKCKEKGVKPEDIKGIKDIEKLPLITKKDYRKSNAIEIVKPRYNISQNFIRQTSGSSGKPATIYIDFFSVFIEILTFLRIFNAYNIKWRKAKMAFIGNLSSVSSVGTTTNAVSRFNLFYNANNIISVESHDYRKNIIKKINDFEPDFIFGFPNDIRYLSKLKSLGLGKDINPEYIATAGYIDDEYKKKIIEEAFVDATVFDVYASSESGLIAFQCNRNKYHIFSDYIFIESIDEMGSSVGYNNKGKTAVTKFFGRGTPIIRYTGLDDTIELEDGDCDCGLTSKFIKKIYGRISQNMIFSNNRIIYPYDVEYTMNKLIYDFNANEIFWFQIIQKNDSEVDIYIKFNKHLHKKDNSFDLILNIIKDRFCNLFGPGIIVNVKEIEKTNQKPFIISKASSYENSL